MTLALNKLISDKQIRVVSKFTADMVYTAVFRTAVSETRLFFLFFVC